MNKIFNDKTLLSIILTIVIGFFVGIVFTFVITSDDKLILNNAINEYISLINTDVLSFKDSFINIFLFNFILVNIIIISSIFIIGIPFIYIINFYKGFNIGFIISLFINIFKFKGIFKGFLFIFPHELLLILFFVFISYISLKMAYKVINSIKNNNSINLRIFYKKYLIIYLISLIFIIISTSIEVFVSSYLLKAIL